MFEDFDIDYSGIGLALRAGNFFADWIFGKGLEDVQKGFEYLQKAIDEERSDYLGEALRFFEKVGYDDKKYIVASSLYGKAICHGFVYQFATAYDEIKAIQDIEVSMGTMKKSVIYDMKSSSRELESTLHSMEANLRKKRPKFKKLWIYLSISIVAFFLIGALIWKLCL